MIDLTSSRDPADLIDALFEARRENRRELQDAVVKLLEHEEPMVREEAVSLLCTKWEMRDLRPKAREMLQHDEDFGVRARAALGLGSVSMRATRQEDAALLVRVFEEEGLPPEVRQACYEALSLIAGRPTSVELDDTGPKNVRALIEEIARLDPEGR